MAILASNRPWLWHVSSCFASEYRSWAILLDRVSNTDIAIPINAHLMTHSTLKVLVATTHVKVMLHVICLFQPKQPSELRLKWRLTDMPRAMSYPQAVVINDNLYIRDGGLSLLSGDIYRYDSQTLKWTKLPEYQYSCFTMTEINHQLVLVGGVDVFTNKTENAIAVYSTSQKWEQPYPPMNTPRMWPAVSIYHQHLIVAGGRDGPFGANLTAVEVLNISTQNSQWFSTTPLSVSCCQMSSTIIQDTLHVLGGSLGKQVLSVFLPGLIKTDKPSAHWYNLSSAPLEKSATISVHGSLLALGGSHDQQRSSAIYNYDQEKKAWRKVGDLPNEREDCACCLLPSGEILVAGGYGRDDWTKRMDTVCCNLFPRPP